MVARSMSSLRRSASPGKSLPRLEVFPRRWRWPAAQTWSPTSPNATRGICATGCSVLNYLFPYRNIRFRCFGTHAWTPISRIVGFENASVKSVQQRRRNSTGHLIQSGETYGKGYDLYRVGQSPSRFDLHLVDTGLRSQTHSCCRVMRAHPRWISSIL
mgnify:CR=1 FL=1